MRIAPLAGIDHEPDPQEIALIEADTVEEVKTAKLVKHYGPGPHPGTGTEQAAHAGTTPRDIVGNLSRQPDELSEGQHLGEMSIGEFAVRLGEEGDRGFPGEDGMTRNMPLPGTLGGGGTMSFGPTFGSNSNMVEMGMVQPHEGTIIAVNAGGEEMRFDISSDGEVRAWTLGAGMTDVIAHVDDPTHVLRSYMLQQGFTSTLPDELPASIGPEEQLTLFTTPELTEEFSTNHEQLTTQDYMAARALLFQTRNDTPERRAILQDRTIEGKKAVARLMKQNHGDAIQAEYDRKTREWHEEQTVWLDDRWSETYDEDSIDGYDMAGNKTWRKLADPPEVIGQTGLRIVDDPAPEAFGEGVLVHTPPSIVRPQERYDLDDAWGLQNFIRDKVGQEPFPFATDWANATGGKAYQLEQDYDEVRSEFWQWVGIDSTPTQDLVLEGLYRSMAPAGDSNEVDISTFVQVTRDHWAESSTHPISVAVQKAVEHNFPIVADTDHFFGAAFDDGGRIYDEAGPIFDAYVQSVYTNTQETFANAGITHLPVTRGMGLNLQDFAEEDPVDGFVFQPGEDVPYGEWHPAKVDLQPLSSFSVSPRTAAGFSFASTFNSGRRDYGTLHRSLVPVEHVWATSLDGFGSMRETEVILLGGRDLDFEMAYWTATEYDQGDATRFAEDGWDNA